ncbi:MAG: glutamine--tRNA ligase/YqeY domain fusion protein [Arenimonas sp.]|nr:glutamine--tRNA ligase/YqeY domain fusion protein [Arenimonas sp.]
MSTETHPSTPEKNDFIRQIIREDLASGKHTTIRTRFPPEPNGYLHIGHAKSICLNFGIGQEFNGLVNLRFDDTNPSKEDMEFVESIQEDVRWLGFHWNELRHASDYFEVFYQSALKLIDDGKAYVCDLSADDVREYRGTLTQAGRNSPYRERSVAENRDLFTRMRAGEFADGERTLRAKIDMASGNINLRDPALYRIRKISHQNTGDAWPIYPMYDYAHCISDALEGITHSLCTLEFEDHRPLYDWCVDNIDLPNHPALWQSLVNAGFNNPVGKPRQIEFSRLNINFTVMSKRKLLALVQDQLVNGWDDPRMPTLCGLRRRGYPAASLRLFSERIGISKQNSVIDYSVLENCVRETLDDTAQRRMAVIQPLKLIITNIADNHSETLAMSNHPKNEDCGKREVPFSNELWIDADDFMLNPVPGYHRLSPGAEVRLRGAGIVKCLDVVMDGEHVKELHCQLDLDSRTGMEGSKRKVKGTIHWVCAKSAIASEFRLFDRLFSVENPDNEEAGGSYQDYLNPESLIITHGFIEASAAQAQAEQCFQFERQGYFSADRYDHTSSSPVFNRSVTLRDTWSAK